MNPSESTDQSWLDDPEKTAAAVTAAAAAAFAVVHEMVPPHHQDLVRYLGGADFAFNVMTWVVIHRNRYREGRVTQDIDQFQFEDAAQSSINPPD